MQLHVVYDENGTLMAASMASDEPRQLIPVAGRRQTYAKLDVPAHMKHLAFRDVASKLKVDVATKQLAAR